MPEFHSLEKPPKKEVKISADKAKSSLFAMVEQSKSLLIPLEKSKSGEMLMEHLIPAIEKDPAVAEAVEIIVNRNPELMRKKDENLKQQLYKWRDKKGIDKDKFEKRKKIFSQWLQEEGSKFVRSSSRPLKENVFRSARSLGKVRHTGTGDAYLGLDRFVFGSWDAIPHPIAAKGKVYELDISKKQDSYFTTMDIAEVYKQQTKKGKTLTDTIPEVVKTYAANLHQLKDMPDFLSDYLALTFESPQEMVKVLKYATSDIKKIERWDEEDAFGEDKRSQEIQKNLVDIYNEIGLLPPLAVEVQVKNQVRVKEK